MPDLGTLLNPCSSSSTLEIPCPNFKPPDQCESSTSPVPDSVKTLDTNHNCSDWEQRLRFLIHSPKKLRALKRCRSKNTNKTTTTSGQEDKSPDEISVGVSGQQFEVDWLWFRNIPTILMTTVSQMAISKGRQERESQNIVKAYLANLRLKEVGTDVLISTYEPS
ncbi:hypothetical protein POM88_013221 [Heracleum sosnowskyi]|uniref:Uncharacterized protein n=1 Tax=Heracleum sosnowskyi TaxID=360622 RepID=A0AAD8J1R2_9APIA|nr:hypothetical protein POM88_013221 [Heracleum sosnowskyi]